MKKNKPIIVDHRYIGDLPFPSWREWHKWRVYRDIKTAQMAVDNLRRKYKNFEFQVRLPTKHKLDGGESADIKAESTPEGMPTLVPPTSG